MKPWRGVKFHSFVSKEEWLRKRNDMGVGGSESAAILGLSPYLCSAQLFYQKLGLAPGARTSLPMIIGNEDENKISKLWSYYDPNYGVDSIVSNYEADKVIRKPIKLNRIIVNDSYPYLFANPDRLFKNDLGDRSILEIKTISHWESQKWESGVPIHYLVQIQHYMLVCDVQYAELAILEANNKIDVIPFEPSHEIQQRIIEKCKAFWDDVVEARRILASGGMELDVQHLVPPPDGSEAYTEFLKERFREGSPNLESTVTGDIEDAHNALAYFRAKEQMESVSRELALYEQKLRERMGENAVLDFGETVGRITWRANKNGVRSFKTASVKKEELATVCGNAYGLEQQE